MRDIQFYGIPSIQGKTPAEAVEILYDHCHKTAIVVEQMNKEIEELKAALARGRF